MTRAEAIKILERRTTIPGDGYTFEQINEALDLALSALRGPTREMVERMRGEWIEDEFAISHCSLCGCELEEPEIITPLCPLCGSPMTEKALDMIMERWKEELDGEQSC